ncbi:macrophage mannose receptor 1-like isoform X1, partial [Clarias magur]
LCGTGAYIPHRYRFVNENKTWNEAQTYCREKYTDLATTNDMEEMNKLRDALTKETAIQAWIGLNKTKTTKWQWSLASETFYKYGNNFKNWAFGQPDNWMGNEFCVHMYADSGLWNDNACNSEFPAVCYY